MPVPFFRSPVTPPVLDPVGESQELVRSLLAIKTARERKAEQERAETRQAELDKQRLEQQAFENEQAILEQQRLEQESKRREQEFKIKEKEAKLKDQQAQAQAKQLAFELEGEQKYENYLQDFEAKKGDAALKLAGKKADVLAKLKDKGVDDAGIRKVLDAFPDVESIRPPRPSTEVAGVQIPLMARAERLKRLREESEASPSVMSAQLRAGAAQLRSFTPKKVTYNGEEILANYDSKTGRYYDVDTGAPLSGVSGPPTADMKNKAAGRKMAMTSIKVVENLSKKVIEDVGVQQRIKAAGRNIQAVFGNDPVYRTYSDSKRALAGNLAVAQQGSRPSDADIEAIWVPLVPDPYRDTRESMELKWFMIKQMTDPDSDIDIDAAWNELYGVDSPATTNDLADEVIEISSDEEFDVLNPGQRFKGPDGKVRVK